MSPKKSDLKPYSIKDINIQAGKIPPQAVDLEEVVLGAAMIEKDALISISDMLKPQNFYKEAHRIIYESILELYEKHEAIDILTVTQQLQKKKKLDEVGGYAYITQLTGKIASAAHIESHALIIVQKFIQRELIRISSNIQKMAFDENEDIDSLLDSSENMLFSIGQGIIRREAAPINALLKLALEKIEEVSKKETDFSGIPSGFTGIDRITSGWQNSDLVIIAARPSMGKTAFVLSMARNMAIDHKKSVAFFSLEMSSLQLVNRLIISETQLPSDKIRSGKLDDYEWVQLENKIETLSNSKIFIDDTPGISIFELRAKCRRLKQKHNIDIIIIDYLQLMTTGYTDRSGNREQEVSNISRSLKAMSKDLDVPVIALSQLNRSVEMRSGNKRPQLSDLRESGAIEQDADIVIFIHRPEKYGLSEYEDEDGESVSTKGVAELIISKHRNGALGDIKLKFIEKFVQFVEFDDFGNNMDTDGSLIMSSKINNEPNDMNKDIKENTDFGNEKQIGENSPF